MVELTLNTANQLISLQISIFESNGFYFCFVIYALLSLFSSLQVPQFILDGMIESELGGSCNIVCTQPWRIAAISVAERVSDERCESSPGSNDSLVGYQVRLDSARTLDLRGAGMIWTVCSHGFDMVPIGVSG